MSTFLKTAALSIALATLTGSALASNDPAPKDGAYRGKGSWKSADQQEGSYTVQADVTGDTIASSYSYNGQTQSFVVKLDRKPNGFLVVRDVEGKKIGTGYCIFIQCHYEVPSSHLEETLTFWEGHLYRLGSKGKGANRVMWIEDLKAE